MLKGRENSNNFFRYIVKSHSEDLNSNQRSQVVWAILNRTRYKNESPEKVGIQRLIAKQVICLHIIRDSLSAIYVTL